MRVRGNMRNRWTAITARIRNERGNAMAGYTPLLAVIALLLFFSVSYLGPWVSEQFIDAGECELVKQFSSQVPIRVISNMLGLPREDEDTFVEWYQLLIAGLGFGGEHMARGIDARNEMWDYIDPMIKERSKNPGEDLLSRLCVAEFDGKRMTPEEVKGFVALLLAA